MSVRTLETTANCNTEEAQEWLTNGLNDALQIPNLREANVAISYLDEDGRVNIVTGQMDPDDGSWDCKTQSHQLIANGEDSIFGESVVSWGVKTYNHLADHLNQVIDDLVPLSDRASEHDEDINPNCIINDDDDE